MIALNILKINFLSLSGEWKMLQHSDRTIRKMKVYHQRAGENSSGFEVVNPSANFISTRLKIEFK